LSLVSKSVVPVSSIIPVLHGRVGTKPGLWTLDWTMDWTMDWFMDSILDWTAGKKSHWFKVAV